MQLKLKVSNIACEGCTEIITKSIPVMESKAKVDIDVNAKITVESAVSEESIKQVIVTAGYGLEGYSFSVTFAVYLIHVFLQFNLYLDT